MRPVPLRMASAFQRAVAVSATRAGRALARGAGAQVGARGFLGLGGAVERRRRVFDAVGDPAHRHGLIALIHEKLAGGVQDPSSQLLPLALSPFGSAQKTPPISELR